MNIIKTAIQAHDANLFETNREVIFAAASKEGAMGAAVLAAMPHYLAFPDTKERVTIGTFENVLGMVRKMAGEVEAGIRTVPAEDYERIVMMREGTREIVGANLPELMLDSEAAFQEMGLPAATRMDPEVPQMVRTIEWWHPELAGSAARMAACKICNVPGYEARLPDEA